MHIRQITVNDNLADIAIQCNNSDWNDEGDAELLTYSESSLRLYLENPHHLMVAAFDGRTIAGIAIGYVLPHPGGNQTLYIDELDVRPSYRRQGIATSIINHYHSLAAELDCSEVWLSTDDQNATAQKLYRSLLPTEDKQAVVFGWGIEKKK